MWQDSKVTDMERLFMLLNLTDYSTIRLRIMGNIFDVVSDNQRLSAFTYEMVQEV